MKRLITEKLIRWKTTYNRKPLMLRGARQVGKTYSIKFFGKEYFTGNVHIVDLEKHSDWHHIFDQNLDVNRIITELEILLGKQIIPGKDLLFFDEIQSCPQAIMSLRYFYEDLPDLHVIAAGSLLEFSLQDISFPVGRIQFLNMYPMNFIEYLWAIDKIKAAEIIQSPPSKQPITIHKMLLELLRYYMFIGGMPECVQTYINTGSMQQIFDVQANLIITYRQDFAKYAPYADKRCLDVVFTSVAKQVGRQIKYSHLAEGYTTPTIKKAFNLLCQAQVIRKIPATSPAGLPLEASASARKFKAIMLDIGLMQHLCNLQINKEFTKTNLLAIYQGALAEQFAGQEFLSSDKQKLYYWARNAKSSSAEVDFLISKNGEIYPIEIKSGVSGKLKSMHILLKEYPNCPMGYVFSCNNFSKLSEQKLTFYPLYYTYQITK